MANHKKAVTDFEAIQCVIRQWEKDLSTSASARSILETAKQLLKKHGDKLTIQQVENELKALSSRPDNLGIAERMFITELEDVRDGIKRYSDR